MKKYFSIFAKTFLFVSLAFSLVAFAVLWRLNIQMPYWRLFLGAFLVSGFLAGSILVFRKTTGKPLFNVIGGFLLVLPAILVLGQTLGIIVFRFSFVLYVFAVLCGAIYGVAVAVVYRKVRKDASALNDLLKENQSEKHQ